MFCYKCGKAIEEKSEICPFCGIELDGAAQELKQENSLGSSLFSTDQIKKSAPSGSVKTHRPSLGIAASSKLILAIGLIAALIAVITAVLYFRRAADAEEKYSVVGLWKSREAISLGENLSELLEESGLPKTLTSAVISLMGLGADGDVTLRFTENGNIYAGVNDFSVSIGNLLWEDLGDNRLMLRYDIQISILGNSVPVTLAYESEYEVDEDSLTLDLFGHRTRFSRLKGQ